MSFHISLILLDHAVSGKVWLLLTLPQTNGIYNWGKSAPRAAKVIVIKIFFAVVRMDDL